MAEIRYIVSSNLDYSKLICNDAGPAYAKSMHWQAVQFDNLNKFFKHEIYVIDNRVCEDECQSLSKIILENHDITFVIKIVDPYYEHKDHFYYQWIKHIITYQNIRLFSVYESKELTSIFEKSLIKPIIYIPYPYDTSKELPLKDLKYRKDKIIIAGSINKNIYPYRSKIWAQTRRSFARLFFEVLKHPGYQEISNAKPLHNLVAESFINYLSKYKFMLLCGSRCNIEFLKFHECAYAGCLPIGEVPTCFRDDIKALFLDLNSPRIFFKAFKIMWNWKKEDHFKTIEKYRSFLNENRNYKLLNQSFLKQLEL